MFDLSRSREGKLTSPYRFQQNAVVIVSIARTLVHVRMSLVVAISSKSTAVFFFWVDVSSFARRKVARPTQS